MKCRTCIVALVTGLTLGIGAAIAAPPATADIHAAAASGDVERIAALVAESPELVSAKDARENTPLHLAVKGLQIAAAERLIAAGANVNEANMLGAAPLHFLPYAGQSGKDLRAKRAALAAVLIKNGADVNARDRRKMTPLHVVAVKGCDELLDPLVAAKSDVNAKDAAGRTPLHYAGTYNHTEIIDGLLHHGVAVDRADDQGDTALHAAVRRFRNEATQRLIAAGADVNAKNMAGQTPLHLATAEGPEVAEVDTLLAKVAEVLIAAGADVNATDQSGFTPLHYAAKKARAQVAAVLRSHGATD